MASTDGDAAGESDRADASDDRQRADREDAEAAKARAVAEADGDPDCERCSKAADFFLFEADRVAKFVCWEHVSPHSAAVDGDPAETPAGRPVALEL